MYYPSQSILNTSFSFPQRIFFYLILIVVSVSGVLYLYVPNFVSQQFDCSQGCIVDDVIMDLYGISDVTDGIMKQVTNSKYLGTYRNSQTESFAFSGSTNGKNISYVLPIEIRNFSLPTITITTQQGKVVSYLIIKNFSTTQNIYRKQRTPLITNPITLRSGACDMIVPLDYVLGKHLSNGCTLSKYTQESVITDDESEIYLFFVTKYDGVVTILAQ